MSSSKYFIFSSFSSLERSGNKSSNSSKSVCVPLLSRNSSERDGGGGAGNICWRLNSGRGSAISCKKLLGSQEQNTFRLVKGCKGFSGKHSISLDMVTLRK